jgi:capsular polysaccharide transport system permease protein
MIFGAGTVSRPLAGESFSEWLRVQVQLVLALAERDVRSRLGENGFGFAMSFMAPLAWIAATYLAFAMFGRTSPVYTDLVTFIISGLIPYAAFRHVVTAVGRTRSTVRGLLIYPSVTEEHAVASAALVEVLNSAILLAVVFAANFLLFGRGEMDDPLTFLWGTALCWALGVSYAYAFLGLARFNDRFNQIGQILLRPSFFLSAVFFTANELPDYLLDVLSWNPLLHAVEIARDGMLLHYQSRVASGSYALLWIAAMLTVGAALNLTRRD